jgi:putative cell wall-binding protein
VFTSFIKTLDLSIIIVVFRRAKEELSLQTRKIKRDSEILQQKECDLQTATEELTIATAENAQKRDQIRSLEGQVLISLFLKI